MNQNIPWEKLAKYFASEMTREETKRMEIWIKADPEREKHVKFLYQIWKESEYLPYPLDVEKAWERLEGNIDRFEDRRKKIKLAPNGKTKKMEIRLLNRLDKPASRRGSSSLHVMLIAASVLIVLTAGLFTYNYYHDLQEAETAQELTFEELTTRDGERAIYTLGDGSRVMLHAGSRLEVPVNFNEENRELFLEGEAYFEVTHNPDKSFVVHADGAYTRVLGTKFLVQAWVSESKQVEVIVEEGKVALGEYGSSSSSAQQEVIITDNQKGVLAAGSSPMVEEVTDLPWQLGWTEGRLVFEDKQLSEILPRLERWYAVEIRAEDKLIANKKLTAEIDFSQPMMEVLKGIALSLDLEFEKVNRTVTFRFQ